MNKKGFTIIEVVASIAIVLFITAMVIYNVAGMSDKSKNEIYKDKINLALIKAKEYGNDNLDSLTTSCKGITIGDLINMNYLAEEENGKIYDPRTNESMNDIWICVIYEDNEVKTYLRDEV